jgi:hypothetical protein
MYLNILRWIVFLPATILISVVCDIIIKIIIKFIALMHDNRDGYARYIQDADSDSHFFFTLMDFLIPAISQFIAVICGIYILPNRRKLGAIMLLCFTIIVAVLVLFTKYSSISVSISFTLGAIFAYYYLKSSDFKFPSKN